MPPLAEIVVGVIMLLGSFLMLMTAIGLVRFPDIYCRMHAAGKAGTLGISMVILSAVIYFSVYGADWRVPIAGVAAIFFQFLTTPVATHLLSRATYVCEYPLSERTAVDDLKGVLSANPDATPGDE